VKIQKSTHFELRQSLYLATSRSMSMVMMMVVVVMMMMMTL
jgi:hypothetical protein